MSGLRVLVLEDEPIIALLLSDVLIGMGHDVCAIESTEAGAVAAAARCQPELMIVDARLVEGSGISAVDRILLSGFVPHVFVSGDTLAGQPISPRAAVLRKPFLESDLVRAIQQALGAGAP